MDKNGGIEMRNREDYPIDFIIAWVDGSDEKWRMEKQKYAKGDIAQSDDREIRFKDLGTLRYWFRAVEKYAPWVRKIHFVTWGHIPEWLNINHPKINIVKHEDYIPEQYLPTFSSHTIELNFHRIQDLAEHFVYFNDDMYLTAPVQPCDFFYKGLPRDVAAINAKWFVEGNTPAYVQIRDTAIINKYFNKNMVIGRNLFGWFNLKYGALNLRTLALLPWPKFITLHTMHLPTSFLKSTFIEVWEKERQVLDNTCMHKIRSYLDVNQWLFQFWQICSNKFCPASIHRGKGFVLGESEKCNRAVYRAIRTNKYKLLCVGEGDKLYDYEGVNRELQTSFHSILPNKSEYER